MTTRFLREARAASKIKSEHVARVTDVDTLDDGAPYMVMEYLDGHDLAGSRKQRGAAADRTTPSTTCSRPARPSPRRTRSASSTATSSRRTSSSPAPRRRGHRQGARLRHLQGSTRPASRTLTQTGAAPGLAQVHVARADAARCATSTRAPTSGRSAPSSTSFVAGRRRSWPRRHRSSARSSSTARRRPRASSAPISPGARGADPSLSRARARQALRLHRGAGGGARALRPRRRAHPGAARARLDAPHRELERPAAHAAHAYAHPREGWGRGAPHRSRRRGAAHAGLSFRGASLGARRHRLGVELGGARARAFATEASRRRHRGGRPRAPRRRRPRPPARARGVVLQGLGPERRRGHHGGPSEGPPIPPDRRPQRARRNAAHAARRRERAARRGDNRGDLANGQSGASGLAFERAVGRVV